MGIYAFGLQGVVLGPLLLCLTLICIEISRKLADPANEAASPVGSSGAGTPLAGTPMTGPYGSAFGIANGKLINKRETPRTGGAGPHHTPVPGFGAARSRRQQQQEVASAVKAA